MDSYRYYRAKDRSVEICLEAIKNITVRGVVHKNKHKAIISNAAGSGKKIEIYTNNSKVPEKIWISAGNTADHHGDFFFLKTPEEGISPEPFIVDMPMFAGYLTARFFTLENDWRFSGVFNYPKLGFSKVSVEETANPQNSFVINWDGQEEFDINNPITGEAISEINLDNAKDYLLRFKKIHLETFDTKLSEFEQDSVLKRTPDWNITLLDNSNKETKVSLYYLPGNGNYHDLEGNELPYNQDIMFGTLGDGELFRVQYAFVF